jgi:hypothetical protein
MMNGQLRSRRKSILFRYHDVSYKTGVKLTGGSVPNAQSWGKRRALSCDPHAEPKFDLMTVPDGALETQHSPVFDPWGDGNGEDQVITACVKANIPLRTFKGFMGGQGKIVDVETG